MALGDVEVDAVERRGSEARCNIEPARAQCFSQVASARAKFLGSGFHSVGASTAAGPQPSGTVLHRYPVHQQTSRSGDGPVPLAMPWPVPKNPVSAAWRLPLAALAGQPCRNAAGFGSQAAGRQPIASGARRPRSSGAAATAGQGDSARAAAAPAAGPRAGDHAAAPLRSSSQASGAACQLLCAATGGPARRSSQTACRPKGAAQHIGSLVVRLPRRHCPAAARLSQLNRHQAGSHGGEEHRGSPRSVSAEAMGRCSRAGPTTNRRSLAAASSGIDAGRTQPPPPRRAVRFA